MYGTYDKQCALCAQTTCCDTQTIYIRDGHHTFLEQQVSKLFQPITVLVRCLLENVSRLTHAVSISNLRSFWKLWQSDLNTLKKLLPDIRITSAIKIAPAVRNWQPGIVNIGAKFTSSVSSARLSYYSNNDDNKHCKKTNSDDWKNYDKCRMLKIFLCCWFWFFRWLFGVTVEAFFKLKDCMGERKTPVKISWFESQIIQI